jgi:tRNA nucleotidyltransferase (CCA-adding enzyme)
MISQSNFIKSLNRELKLVGARLYYVGGAVRDEFLKLATNDLDLVVTGVEKEVFEGILAHYCNVQLVGKSFGVYKCKQDGCEIDIAFPRKEVSTGELHCDFEVEHGAHISLEEDLSRRDFTINAMAKDVETGELVDPYRGSEDIGKMLLRQLSDNSIKEDYLRALRAIQFVARFGFDIEEETLANIKKYAYLNATISVERISIELMKFFKGTYLGKAVDYLRDCDLLGSFFGDIPSEDWSRLESFIKDEQYDEVVVFSMYLYFLEDVSKVQEILLIDKATLRIIQKILSVIYKDIPDVVEVKKTLSLLGINNYKRLLIIKKYLGLFSEPEYEQQLSVFEQVTQQQHPYLLEHLVVNGNDLTENGLIGEQIGETLRAMLEEVIIDPSKNDRDYLLTNFVLTNKQINIIIIP